MLVLRTMRSVYLLDTDLHLVLQVPGGTLCGIAQGEWHSVAWDSLPRVGEPLFCSVVSRDGTAVGLRTSPILWIGPAAALPAAVALASVAPCPPTPTSRPPSSE